MRSHTKTSVVAILAALALIAISSASASAAPCTAKAGSKNYQLCINGAGIGTATSVPISGKGTSPLVIDLSNWVQQEFAISCTKESEQSGAAIFDEPGTALTLHLSPEVEECHFTGAPTLVKKCSVNNRGAFKSTTGKLLSLESAYIEPQSGTAFWEWTMGNKGAETCSATFKGTHATGGQYACTVIGAAVEAVEHEVRCASTSKYQTILVATPTSTPLSYTENVSLGGVYKGQKFSIYEG
jgi:hypothetical protein